MYTSGVFSVVYIYIYIYIYILVRESSDESLCCYDIQILTMLNLFDYFKINLHSVKLLFEGIYFSLLSITTIR